MKKYHVIFKDETTDFFSKGDLIDAEDEVVAILKFRDKFPNVIFLGMFSTEISHELVNNISDIH